MMQTNCMLSSKRVCRILQSEHNQTTRRSGAGGRGKAGGGAVGGAKQGVGLGRGTKQGVGLGGAKQEVGLGGAKQGVGLWEGQSRSVTHL